MPSPYIYIPKKGRITGIQKKPGYHYLPVLSIDLVTREIVFGGEVKSLDKSKPPPPIKDIPPIAGGAFAKWFNNSTQKDF